MKRSAFALVALLLPACGHVPPAVSYLPSSASMAESAGAPRRALFPATPSGVHLNLVFNYDVRDVEREIGRVDLVWGASAPKPRQVYNQFYTPFEREGGYAPVEHSLAWWQRHHPDWIEYRCDRKTVAFEFGDTNDVPLDMANPAFRAYQQQAEVERALRAGYNGAAFDNLELGNGFARCGHFTLAGAWVRQYTGRWDDPAYANDAIAWAKATYTALHAYSPTATMAINYSYESGFTFERNYALMSSTDLLFDESGFTNWGATGHNRLSPAQWRDVVRAIGALQRNGNCYTENGEEPAPSAKITQAERLWVVGNYLLTRDACTFMWISGLGPHGFQEYGRMLFYPEYRLDVGAPTGTMQAAGNGWQRAYGHGLVLVNPSSQRVRFRLTQKYVDENGTPHAGSIVLAPATAQILLL